eukprot:1599007-Pleurochrysis_carterae.AAC.1
METRGAVVWAAGATPRAVHGRIWCQSETLLKIPLLQPPAGNSQSLGMEGWKRCFSVGPLSGRAVDASDVVTGEATRQ